MKRRERDVIAELHLYAKSSLPTAAAEAWVESLTPEEKQVAFDYLRGKMNEIIATWERLTEVLEGVGYSFAEGLAVGIKAREEVLGDG